MKIKDFIKENDQLNEIGSNVFGPSPGQLNVATLKDPRRPRKLGPRKLVKTVDYAEIGDPDNVSDSGWTPPRLVTKANTPPSPYKEPDPISDTLPGEPGSGLERKDNSQAIHNTEKSKRDQAQRLERERQAELARLKANAGMKDSDYKSSVAPNKRTAQDMALDKEYPYKAKDGRRLKYPPGDIRNAFHSSPDSKAPGDKSPVIRGNRVGKRLIDQPPVTRRGDDDRR